MAAMSPTAAVQEVLQRCRDWSPERYAAAQRALAELLSGEARYGFPTQSQTNIRSGVAGGLGTLFFGVMFVALIWMMRISGPALLFIGAMAAIMLVTGGAMLWRSVSLALAASSLSQEASAQPPLTNLGEADALTQEVWSMYAGLRWPHLQVLAVRLGGVKLILEPVGRPISPIFAAFNAVVIWPRGVDIAEVSLPGLTAPRPTVPPVAPRRDSGWEVYEPGVVGSGGDDFSSAMAAPPPPPPPPPAPPVTSAPPAAPTLPVVAPPEPTIPPAPRRAY